MKKEKNKQISFDEYKERFSEKRNEKTLKTFLLFGISIVGVFIGVALGLLTLRIYELNEIAGYVAIGVSVLIFILLYLVPVIRIYRVKYFITSVDDEVSAAKAKRHNRHVREQIADEMIEFTETVKGADWYDKVRIGDLAIARNRHDDKALVSSLREIYKTDIKAKATKIITDRALQVGLITAASPNENLDAASVAVLEVMLIKDIIFLYGFRPSDRQLAKIYRTVIINTLIAYGVSATFNRVTFSIVNGISIFNSALGNIIASASQGVINGIMTIILGEQTRKLLLKEFHLQEVLDGFEFEDDLIEQDEMIEVVKKELSSKKKAAKAA